MFFQPYRCLCSAMSAIILIEQIHCNYRTRELSARQRFRRLHTACVVGIYSPTSLLWQRSLALLRSVHSNTTPNLSPPTTAFSSAPRPPRRHLPRTHPLRRRSFALLLCLLPGTYLYIFLLITISCTASRPFCLCCHGLYCL